MRIVEAYKVPTGNVSPDIFKLPCVNSVRKKNGIEYGVFVKGKFSYPCMAYARATDWICKESDGVWNVLTDAEYQQANQVCAEVMARKGGEQ